MKTLNVYLLGAPEFHHQERLLSFPARKAVALLVYLAVEKTPQPREKVAALLWEQSTTTRARAALRNSLYQLRTVLPIPEALASERTTIAWEPQPNVWMDVDQLARVADVITSAPGLGSQQPVPQSVLTTDDLLAVAELYRGDFLEGFVLEDAPEFENWMALQRERYHRQMETVLSTLAQRQYERGAWQSALDLTSQWLAHNPLSEAAFRQTMRICWAMGDRTGAYQAYVACREMLQAELGLEPSPRTQRLAEEIGTAPEATHTLSSAQLAATKTSVAATPARFTHGPLVGREDEFKQLVSRYHAASNRETHVVWISGEPGIGKTRLSEEFLQWAKSQHATVLMGRSYESGQDLPYQPLVDALRPWLEVENAPDDLIADPWLQELGRLLPEVRERYPDLPPPNEDDLAQPRLFEAIVQVTLALADREYLTHQVPLIIFIDDLQWTDASSIAFLRYACRRWISEQTPLLLLCTQRTEAFGASTADHNGADTRTEQFHAFQMELARQNIFTRMELPLLSAAHIRQFLASAQIDAAKIESAEIEDEAQLAQWLSHHTQGQPFYMVAILEDLVERGLLGANVYRDMPQSDQSQIDTLWQDASSLVNEANEVEIDPEALPPLSIPAKVHQLIASRLRRLTPISYDLLVATSVLGENCTFELMCQVAEVGLQQGLNGMDELLRNGLLLEMESKQSLDSPLFYQFTHDMIRHTCYADAGEARRQIFHARALEALMARRADSARLAYHAIAARDQQAAFHHSMAAGEQAIRLSAGTEAIKHLEAAQARLGAVANPPLRTFFLQLGRAYELAGKYDRALSTYDELQEIAQSQQDKPLELAALMARTTVYAAPTQHYDPDSVTRLTGQALPLARDLNDAAAEAKIFWNLMLLNIFTGDFASACEQGEQSLAIAQEHGLTEQTAYTLHDLQRPYAFSGNADKALAVALKAQELWQELDNQAMLADNLNVLAGFFLAHGEYDRSLEMGQRGLKISQETGNIWNQSFAQFQLSSVHFFRANYHRAIATMNASIKLGNVAGFMIPALFAASLRAIIYTDMGHYDRAAESAEAALAQADQMHVSLRPIALTALAYVHLHAGNEEEAAACCDEMLALIPENKNEMALLIIPIGLGECLLRFQRYRELDRQIHAFLDIFSASDMTLLNPSLHLFLARAALAQDQPEEADNVLDTIQPMVEARSENHTLLPLFATRRKIALLQDKPERVELFDAKLHALLDSLAAQFDPSPEGQMLRDAFLSTQQAKLFASLD